MSKGMLIDTTKCIGCRACQIACKSWNNLSGRPTTFSPTVSSPRYLSSTDFTRIIFVEQPLPEGGVRWHFVKRQCFHCNDPACVSACPVAALIKLPSGPVVYDDAKCIGCRYCMMACPFQIPKFQWEAAIPYIRKCTFCADRQAIGLQPACSASCPTGALLFGERQELIREAWRRIKTTPERYYHEVYGETTGGGTAKLYLTAASLVDLGLHHRGFRTDLGSTPQGLYGRTWMANVPYVALAVGGLTLGLYYLNQRRAAVQAAEKPEKE